MSMSNTILGNIVKNAKMRWDGMSEEESEQFVDALQSAEQVDNEVTYGSEKNAINEIAKITGLNDEQVKTIYNDIETKDHLSNEISKIIQDKIDGANKNEHILRILSNIHDEWVRNNGKKFQARNKDFQFVDLRLLPYSEVESDLIFLQPILEGCGIHVNNAELEEYFKKVQKEYMEKEGIIIDGTFSHEALVKKIKQGSNFYEPIKSLKTKKGIDNGQEYEIDELLEDDSVAENVTEQIENHIGYGCTRTDLHTHLNAILPSNELLELANECNLDVSKINSSIRMTRNGTFSEMLKIDRDRNNLIIKEIIKDGYINRLLQKIAESYKKHGIKYTEITAGEDVLKEIIKQNVDIDKIEQETGVKLRFLLLMHRSNAGKENRDKFISDEIQELIQNAKYIKGVDLCGNEDDGHELKNQTLFLEKLADYTDINPNFTIRLHSGETKKDPTGLYDALNSIKERCDLLGYTYPKIRIGHAIHGINPKSIDLMKEMGATVELNLASNLRLLNLNLDQLLEDEDLKQTIILCEKSKIPIFLGTDGYGIYGTVPEEQIELAKKAGIDINQVVENENKYLAETRKNEKIIKKGRKKLSKKSPEKAKIKRRLKAIGVDDVSEKEGSFKKLVNGKLPIIVAGSSLKTRDKINIEEYRNLAITFQTLVDVIDSNKAFFVTGGTNCGPEMLLHDAINKRNLKSNVPIICLGAIPSCIGNDDNKSDRNDFKKIKSGTITHGIVVDASKSWSQFPAKLLEIANGKYTNKNGIGIFIGGGNVVSDEIKLALTGDYTGHITPIQSWLFNSSESSASSQAITSSEYKNCEFMHQFSNVEDLIKSIYKYSKETNTDIFNKDFDINKIGEYIQEAKRKVDFDYKIIRKSILSEGKIKEGLLKYLESNADEAKNLDEVNECVKQMVPNDSIKEVEWYLSSYLKGKAMAETRAEEIPLIETSDLSISDVNNGKVKIPNHEIDSARSEI